jgi:hypothetical protein
MEASIFRIESVRRADVPLYSNTEEGKEVRLEAVFWSRIREVLASFLGRDTGFPEVLVVFLSLLKQMTG